MGLFTVWVRAWVFSQCGTRVLVFSAYLTANRATNNMNIIKEIGSPKLEQHEFPKRGAYVPEDCCLVEYSPPPPPEEPGECYYTAMPREGMNRGDYCTRIPAFQCECSNRLFCRACTLYMALYHRTPCFCCATYQQHLPHCGHCNHSQSSSSKTAQKHSKK